MMYPILCKVRFESLHQLLHDRRLLTHLLTSFVANWLVCPALMTGLAWAFLPDRPDLRNGVIVVGLARCIAMVLVWVDLAGGDGAYCAVLVAANSLLQVLLFAPLAVFFLRVVSRSSVGAPNGSAALGYATVATSVAVFLGVPLAAAVLTRLLLRPLVGERAFQTRFLRPVAPLSLLALLFTVVVLFAGQGAAIVRQVTSVLRVLPPLVVYFAVVFAGTLAVCRRMGFGYGMACTQSFTAASNNFELAIAVVVSVYGIESEAALAATVGPLVEVPVLVGLVYVMKWAKARWKWAD